MAKNLLELHQQSPIEIADGEAAILRLFSKLLGMKHIIPIGRKVVKNDQNNYKGIFQPLYHIDLFMTLAGKYQGKNLLFMGSIELAQTILNQRFRKNMHFPFDTISSEINGIQKDLIQNTTTRSLDQPPQFIHELIPLLYWDNCFFSFNNVLVEVTEHGKKIYAPDYIDEESPENSEFNSIITIFKQECERIWKDYGFSTIWTGTGSYNLMWARKKGGLRCVTKVIKRGKYVP